ncbi:MAG: hypothetical protein JW749_07740 [Sedimentisphaerales bacterium]|nr:hypothetical protein [Sedimentisphaerales bacterium]
MKKVLRLSVIVSLLLPISRFGFSFFGGGGCIIPVVTPITFYLCALILFCCAILLPMLFIIILAGVITKWRISAGRLILSLILMGVCIAAEIPINRPANSLASKRFEKYLPEYDRAVKELENNATFETHYAKPSGWRRLAILPPVIYRERDGTLTVEFYTGGIGPPLLQTAYIYRSNGLIGPGSKTAKRWHRGSKLNEHWFRASD